MADAPHTITFAQARRAALNAQLLDGRWKPAVRTRAGAAHGAQAVSELVQRLGYIQIDTIAVVERAHHHTQWVRLPHYRPDWLDHALSVDRSVFEYWGHAASYLPIADYRYYLPLMQRYRKKPHSWADEMKRQHGRVMKSVLARIRAEGPLTTSDFETPPGSTGAWWGWKPAKAALEILFWEGTLMISGRKNFQRVYDLTERVLPAGVDTAVPSARELGRFLVRRALNAYALAEDKDIREHLDVAGRGVADQALRQMLGDGEVVPVQVGDAKRTYYALPDSFDAVCSLRPVKPRLHLLSPFDNLVIQRRRILRLFDFDYTIECYTPEPKRKYGYFTLPILWGEQLVGRLDPKADRRAGVLLVRNLALEPAYSPDEEFIGALAARLIQFAGFNGCHGVEVLRAGPARLRTALNKELRRADGAAGSVG